MAAQDGVPLRQTSRRPSMAAPLTLDL